MNEVNALLERAWWAVAEHLWQATLFLVPLLLVAALLRPAPARVRAAAWTLALLKLVLPLGLASALLLRPTGPEPAPAAATLASFETVVDVLVLRPRPASDDGSIPWGIALTAAWLAGFVAVLAWRGRGARSDAVESARLEPPVRERLERLAREAGLDPGRVRAVSGGVPRVRGMLRPRVEVPLALVTTLGDAALRAALLHEAAHVERRDPLRDGGLRVVLAAFWFYPPASLIVRRLRGTAEIACDERALARGATAPDLAQALASAIRLAAHGMPRAASACMAASSPRSLLQDRFQRLDQPPRTIMNRHRIALVAAGLLVAISALVPSRVLAAGDAVLESLRAPALPFSSEAAGLAQGDELVVGVEIDVRADGAAAGGIALPPGLAPDDARELEAVVREIVKSARFSGSGRTFVEIVWPVSSRGMVGAGAAVIEKGASGVRAVIRPPVILGQAVTPPQLAKKVEPSIPDAIVGKSISGAVIIETIVDADGTIASARILRGLPEHPEVEAAALEAVRQWIYEPARLGDQPVPASLVIRIMYELGE